jgi:hypothetical protein
LRRIHLALLLLTAGHGTQAKAQTLGLAQVLEAARQNLDVSTAQQILAAAQADVVSKKRLGFKTHAVVFHQSPKRVMFQT